MQKVYFVFQEFLRSLKNSLFKDLILMITFSISIIMAILMCSYYFDMGERYEDVTQSVGECEWYNLQYIWNKSEVVETASTKEGFNNALAYYDEIINIDRCPFFSIHTTQSLTMREKDLNDMFGNTEYYQFSDDEELGTIMGYFGQDAEGEVCEMRAVSSMQMDMQACKIFGVKVQEGEGFTEENMLIDDNSDCVPVLLGNDYKGLIDIGTEFETDYCGFIYKCKVVGILEEELMVPNLGRYTEESISLDKKIIFPYGLELSKDIDINPIEAKKYVFLACSSIDNGTIRISTDDDIAQIVDIFRITAEKYGLPSVEIIGTSMAMSLFRNEAITKIKVMLILTIVLLSFAFYGMFVTFYDKVQSNKRVYGIFLMNGCSMPMIVIPCMIEIAVILLPSFLVSRYVFTVENMGVYKMDAIMNAVYLAIAAIYFIGMVLILALMRGVDTEKLVRQKE